MLDLRSKWGAGLLVTGLLCLAGCSTGANGETSDSANEQPGTAIETPAASESDLADAVATADLRACGDMETLIAKISVSAARWQPKVNPFDDAVASTLDVVVLGMGEAENKAGTDAVRRAIHDNTLAFGTLARAMSGTKPKKVQNAIGDTQVAFASLKGACAWS